MSSRTKRLIGLFLTVLMTAGILAVGALTADAAVTGAGLNAADVYYSGSNTGIGMTMVIIIIAIIVLLIIIGVVAVIIVVNNKQKNAGMNPPRTGTNNPQYPNTPQTPAQPPYSQPTYTKPQQHYTPPQTPPAPAVPVDDGAGETSVLLDDGAGETTVLSAEKESDGFKLLRKKNNESVPIDKPEFLIGKEKKRVDYCIADNSSVSRAHAKIRIRAGRCYISDLGSTNCTFVNGVKLSPNQEVILSSGDKIKISNEEFEFLG